MNVSDLGAIIKLAAASPNDAKALIKLLSVDVLKSLGGNDAEVMMGDKTLKAQLQEADVKPGSYWANTQNLKTDKPLLFDLIKIPSLLKMLPQLPLKLSPEQFLSLLKQANPPQVFKDQLLGHLLQASSKEEFSALSQLLLSLSQNTLTLPLEYHNYFAMVQIKKRFSKKEKKQQLDFYAALHFLGPVSGSISLIEERLFVQLYVAYESSLKYLEHALDQLHLNAQITLKIEQNITPIFEASQDNILDISI